MPAIQVIDLDKSYGPVHALKELSFEVEEGEFFGFLGLNGAGKTTTIKILTGQLSPNKGCAEVLGIDIQYPQKIKKVVGIVPEITSLPSFLTSYEYLEFVCRVRDVDTENIPFWLDFLDLTDKKNDLCRDLSKGMKQKLSFAAAFIHEPRLVFLDEPFNDIDPLMQRTMKAFLKNHVKGGGTIFLSTHILEIAEKLCSSVTIIHKGTLLQRGPLHTFLEGWESLEEAFVSLVESNE